MVVDVQFTFETHYLIHFFRSELYFSKISLFINDQIL